MDRDIMTTHREEQAHAISLLRPVFTEDDDRALAIKAGILRDDRYDRGRWLTLDELRGLKLNHDKVMKGEPLTAEQSKWVWPPKRPSAAFD